MAINKRMAEWFDYFGGGIGTPVKIDGAKEFARS